MVTRSLLDRSRRPKRSSPTTVKSSIRVGSIYGGEHILYKCSILERCCRYMQNLSLAGYDTNILFQEAPERQNFHFRRYPRLIWTRCWGDSGDRIITPYLTKKGFHLNSCASNTLVEGFGSMKSFVWKLLVVLTTFSQVRLTICRTSKSSAGR